MGLLFFLKGTVMSKNVEIERKFLVANPELFLRSVLEDEGSVSPAAIHQGYLVSSKGDLTVRIRQTDDCDYTMTIKGPPKPNKLALERDEVEVYLSDEEFNNLLPLCKTSLFKLRWEHRGFDVDFFPALGWWLAEFEEKEDGNWEFEQYPWLGEEVTGNEMYMNSEIAHRPIAALERAMREGNVSPL